jgi:Gluconate 2-dehydrogenase subunit 3
MATLMSEQASGYLFFDAATAPVFRAIAGCIVPSEPGSPGADSDAALALTDRAIADRPERDRKLLGVFLRAVERLPLLRYGRRFTRLDRERQAAVLAWLESNTLVPRLRQGFFGVKTFALLGYYGGQESFGELRYPGPRSDAPYYRKLRLGEAPKAP